MREPCIRLLQLAKDLFLRWLQTDEGTMYCIRWFQLAKDPFLRWLQTDESTMHKVVSDS